MLYDTNAKIARIAGYICYFRQGEQLNIVVPADLDQFR